MARIQASLSRAPKPSLDSELLKVENFHIHIRRLRSIALCCETPLTSFTGVVFRVWMRERFYDSVEALQTDLDAWLAFHNAERPHLGHRNMGRSAIGTVMSNISQDGRVDMLGERAIRLLERAKGGSVEGFPATLPPDAAAVLRMQLDMRCCRRRRAGRTAGQRRADRGQPVRAARWARRSESSSETRKASSRDWLAFNLGSQAVW